MTLNQPTPFQLLRHFRNLTGEQVTLGRYDRVEALDITATSITLLVETHKFTERAREDRLTAKGLRMISHNTATGRRRVIESWDDDFTPRVVRHGDWVVTESEWYDKRDWEALCAKPGDDSRFGGRDSVGREVQAIEWRLESSLFSTSESTAN